MFGSCAFRVPLSLQLVVPGYELDCVSAALVKRILLRYVFDSQFDPGWSPPDHSDAFLCNRIRPQITVVLLLMGFHFIHFFSTPSTIGTDILSIRSSICALSCSSTSGEMNRWLSSRSWKTKQCISAINFIFHLDNEFRTKSELLIEMEEKLQL